MNSYCTLVQCTITVYNNGHVAYTCTVYRNDLFVSLIWIKIILSLDDN